MALGFLVLVALIVFILYNVLDIIRILVRWYFGDSLNQYLLLARLDPLYKKPLETYLRFYRQLSADNKVIFEKRVQKFINKKKFIARGFDQVTDEMKALIAGAAIQLTFGHPSIYLTHFRRILIYKDDYYSEISRKYHKGEVNANGIIVLSWKNFVDGFIDNDDGINLGLHEMAHALRLENAITDAEYGFLDDKLLAQWTNLCYIEIEKMNEGTSDFFRPYAAANSQEFFAVAVENFFERPEKFREWNPALYDCLAAMLNQSPLVH